MRQRDIAKSFTTPSLSPLSPSLSSSLPPPRPFHPLSPIPPPLLSYSFALPLPSFFLFCSTFRISKEYFFIRILKSKIPFHYCPFLPYVSHTSLAKMKANSKFSCSASPIRTPPPSTASSPPATSPDASRLHGQRPRCISRSFVINTSFFAFMSSASHSLCSL